MAWLLDTNLLSELRKGRRCDPHVLRWEAALGPERTFISELTLMELRRGILKLHRSDANFARILAKWYDTQVRPSFAGRVLSVDSTVAEDCAELMTHRTVPLADALIAATARIHGLRLATRNVQAFAGLDLEVANPWDG
jgi:predicted nucleic acid-binding protein